MQQLFPDTAPRLLDGSPPMTPEALLAEIAAAGIAVKSVGHPPVFTVEEAKALRGSLPGAHVKNLFLRNKKGAMWLFTCLEDRQIDLRSLGERLGAGRLSFGSAERLMAHLGVTPGSVTTLAAVNDRSRLVEVVLDEALLAAEVVNLHPLTNDQTTAIAPGDLLRLLEAWGHPPRIVRLAG